jgi:hypothetical protein
MCLISVAPKGTSKDIKDIKEFVKSGFDSNRDGSGFMYKRNGENTITISKGFADMKLFLEAIEGANLGVDDELVVHHRIGTSGLRNALNTHPFVVDFDPRTICAVDITTDKPCLAHNGMFHNLDVYEKINPDFSDTYAFVRYILSNKGVFLLLEENPNLFAFLLSDVINGSRLALLHPTKDVIMIGDFVEDSGYHHSHKGYKSYDYGYNRFSLCGRNVACRGDEEGPFYEYEDDETRDPAPVNNSTINKKEIEDWEFLNQGISLNNSVTKTLLMKLDSDLVVIDKDNYNHFFYVSKKDYDKMKEAGKFELQEIHAAFDEKASFQSMKVTLSEACKYFAVRTDDIMDGYYYIPKSLYTAIYKDYLNLIREVKFPGKKTWKKLVNYLNKKHASANDDLLLYEKTGKLYQKKALILYRDYLKRSIPACRNSQLVF